MLRFATYRAARKWRVIEVASKREVPGASRLRGGLSRLPQNEKYQAHRDYAAGYRGCLKTRSTRRIATTWRVIEVASKREVPGASQPRGGLKPAAPQQEVPS